MRVTIGERLGKKRAASDSDVALIHNRRPVSESDAVPEPIEREIAGPTAVKLSECRSSTLPYGVPFVRSDDGGPARVRGEMVWLKKDVSILCIEGRRDLSPDEFSENRRR